MPGRNGEMVSLLPSDKDQDAQYEFVRFEDVAGIERAIPLAWLGSSVTAILSRSGARVERRTNVVNTASKGGRRMTEGLGCHHAREEIQRRILSGESKPGERLSQQSLVR